jgi:hypothetical protein
MSHIFNFTQVVNAATFAFAGVGIKVQLTTGTGVGHGVGLDVVGFPVMGLNVVGFLVGLNVVGFFVGLNVVGLAVVGGSVGRPVAPPFAISIIVMHSNISNRIFFFPPTRYSLYHSVFSFLSFLCCLVLFFVFLKN